jgi:hypothetical protein
MPKDTEVKFNITSRLSEGLKAFAESTKNATKTFRTSILINYKNDEDEWWRDTARRERELLARRMARAQGRSHRNGSNSRKRKHGRATR